MQRCFVFQFNAAMRGSSSQALDSLASLWAVSASGFSGASRLSDGRTSGCRNIMLQRRAPAVIMTKIFPNQNYRGSQW